MSNIREVDFGKKNKDMTLKEFLAMLLEETEKGFLKDDGSFVFLAHTNGLPPAFITCNFSPEESHSFTHRMSVIMANALNDGMLEDMEE